MITNEERREVAVKLRELGNDITEDRFFHWDDAVCESWHAIVKAVGVDNGNPYDDHKETCNRLAELIKPTESKQTCQIKNTCFDEFAIYDYLTCGHVNLRHHPEPTSYCSTCGAEVMNDD